MKACLTQAFAGAFAITALSLLGCSSQTGGPPPSGSGGSTGGAITTSAVSAGGTTTSPTSSGGALPSGGTPASGGQSQAGSVSQGGSATGGAVTSAAGQPATGGNDTGGRASGGAASGGIATGGSVAGGSMPDAGVIGGSTTGDAAVDGKATTGGSTGAPDGAATGGRPATDGAAPGGTVAGGTTATGGAPPLGGGLGSSDGKTPITVWMSGDSTMQGDTIDTTACASCPCGWGAQFSTVFNSNVKVIDRAISGRSIKTWLYDKNVSTKADANGECILTGTTYSDDWNAMLDANTGMKRGDYLIIEFGINDGSDCSKSRHVGIDLFKTYLTDMAKAASDRGAQAIFLTPTNAIVCTGSTANTNTRGGYPAATIAAGAAANVPVIDVTTLSAALYTSSGLCPNSNDYSSTTSKVGQFFCGDHTHFEKAGALAISQMVGKALKNQGIGLGAYVVN